MEKYKEKAKENVNKEIRETGRKGDEVYIGETFLGGKYRFLGVIGTIDYTVVLKEMRTGDNLYIRNYEVLEEGKSYYSIKIEREPISKKQFVTLVKLSYEECNIEE